MLSTSIWGNCQYHLKGKINDYRDGEIIFGTSVLVFSLSDSSYKIPFKHFDKRVYTYLNSTISNLNGDFIIDNIRTRNFKLLIEILGYEKLLINNITFCEKDTINLGSIYLFRHSSIAGFNEYYPGDLEEIRKTKRTEFTFIYPPKGNSLKMKFEDDIVTINYNELLRGQNK
jgi:hypothetical protein